jgi:hypothetical protein
MRPEIQGLLRRKVNKMEKVLMLLVAVFMVFGFSMVGFASDQNTAGSSSNWKQLDRIANSEYAGIGEATKIGLASGGEQLTGLDELSGSESQTPSMRGARAMKVDRLATCGPGEMYVGAVAWVDPDIHRIMVSGRDGSKIFNVSGATMKAMPEADQLISVTYTVTNGERLASSVTAIPWNVAQLYVAPY